MNIEIVEKQVIQTPKRPYDHKLVRTDSKSRPLEHFHLYQRDLIHSIDPPKSPCLIDDTVPVESNAFDSEKDSQIKSQLMDVENEKQGASSIQIQEIVTVELLSVLELKSVIEDNEQSQNCFKIIHLLDALMENLLSFNIIQNSYLSITL